MTAQTYPYVEHLSIRNVRSIQWVDVDLGDFSVFVGPNGSGKTNLVQAMRLFGDLLERGTTDPVEALGWEEIVRRTKKRAHGIQLAERVVIPGEEIASLRRRSRNPSPGFRSDVHVDLAIHLKPGKDDTSIRVEKEELGLFSEGVGRLSITVEGDRVSVDRGGTSAEEQLADLLVPAPVRAHRSGQQLLFSQNWTEALEQYFAPASLAADEEGRFLRLLSRPRFFSPLLDVVISTCGVRRLRLDATALRADSPARGAMGAAGENLAAAVAALRGIQGTPKRQFTPILTALQDIFPRSEDIKPVRVQPGRLALTFVEHGVTEPFGQASVSDGVLHALALLVALEERSKGLLAVEEPENAIHPWSIRVLMDRIQARRSRQVILTTHSVEVVNEIRDPDALFIVEVDEHGTHVAQARSNERKIDTILRETGQPLGEVWREGALGGIPGNRE